MTEYTHRFVLPSLPDLPQAGYTGVCVCGARKVHRPFVADNDDTLVFQQPDYDADAPMRERSNDNFAQKQPGLHRGPAKHTKHREFTGTGREKPLCKANRCPRKAVQGGYCRRHHELAMTMVARKAASG